MSDDRQLPKELVDVLANEILKKTKTHTKSMDEWQKTWQGIRKGVGEPTRGHTCVLPNLPCGAKKMARTILSAFHFFHSVSARLFMQEGVKRLAHLPRTDHKEQTRVTVRLSEPRNLFYVPPVMINRLFELGTWMNGVPFRLFWGRCSARSTVDRSLLVC